MVEQCRFVHLQIYECSAGWCARPLVVVVFEEHGEVGGEHLAGETSIHDGLFGYECRRERRISTMRGVSWRDGTTRRRRGSG